MHKSFFALYFSPSCAWHKTNADSENVATLSPHTTKIHRDSSPHPTQRLPVTPVPPSSPLLHWLELQDHLGFGILRVFPFVAVTWYNHHIAHRDTHFGVCHLSHEAVVLRGAKWRQVSGVAAPLPAQARVQAGMQAGAPLQGQQTRCFKFTTKSTHRDFSSLLDHDRGNFSSDHTKPT